MRQIILKNTSELVPYAQNARLHTEQQIEQVAASITEFGFTNPVLIDEKDGIIAGHCRVLAAKVLNWPQVPCIVLDNFTPEQKRAYILADNKLALNADWDAGILCEELSGLQDTGFNMDLTGFSLDELEDIFIPGEPATDPDAIPDPPEEPIAKPGDVWILGDHRAMCGDSTVTSDVEKLMDGSTAQLLHADPPYGMGKEAEGVANDNLRNEKLDAFQMEWWTTFRTFLADNASAYIWGNAPELWRLWYGGLKVSERLTFRNEIVWGKQSGAGIASDSHRQYPTVTERCLFFMLGEQGFNTNADNYWLGFDPIRIYLRDERDKMGWNNKTVADFFGFHPRMADHWFSPSQWIFIKKGQYERLQTEAADQAFARGYEGLRAEYDESRAYFDNAHENMTDVWEYPRVIGADRHGHATPKPVEMMARIMKSSLPKGGLCVEPFGGSGSTLIGAERTRRRCYTMELQAKYVDVIVNRWQDYTGKKAVLESSG